jgi:hypothetical protein
MANFASIGMDGAGSTRNRVTNAIAHRQSAGRASISRICWGRPRSRVQPQPHREGRPHPPPPGSTSLSIRAGSAVIDQHGRQYGLGWAADAIGQTSSGRYYVSDSTLRQQILDLRKHPETASVMAAEHAADNKALSGIAPWPRGRSRSISISRTSSVSAARPSSSPCTINIRARDHGSLALPGGRARQPGDLLRSGPAIRAASPTFANSFANRLQQGTAGVDRLGGPVHMGGPRRRR